MTNRKLQMNAVAFREGELWVIQGVEYDIAAHADDVALLPDAFIRAVMDNICITKQLGRDMLEGVPAAPHKYAEMYAQAAVEMRPTVAHMDQPDVAVRLVA